MSASIKITSFATLIEALDNRIGFFHTLGGRISDHSLEIPLAGRAAADSDLQTLFAQPNE